MDRTKITLLTVFIIACTCLAAADKDIESQMVREMETIEAGGAQWVEMKVEMDTGELRMLGNASTLLHADYSYSHKAYKPKIDYKTRKDKGTLKVIQPQPLAPPLGEVRNEWILGIEPGIPVDLEVERGEGLSRLNLEGINLAGLILRLKGGHVKALLDGTYPNLEKIKVRNQNASFELEAGGRFPALTEVDVNTWSGHGSVGLNGEHSAPLDLKITIGNGNLSLTMTGAYSAPAKLKARLENGDAKTNFAGNWKADLTGEIETLAGNMKIKLPSDVGVFVETAAAEVTAEGFNAKLSAFTNDIYTNDAYGQAPVNLRLKLIARDGSVVMELVNK